MGCMEDKGTAAVCPFCGYSENAPRIQTCLPPRSVIGSRYLVGRVLSYNGEGVTYMGYDALKDQKVEIREYFPDTLVTRGPGGQSVTARPGCQIPFKTYLSDFAEMMEKLLRLGSLTCLQQVRAVEEQNGTLYAIQEHLVGETLQQYLDRRKLMLTWTEASDLLLPLIKTMNLVHREGLLHRGISPATIWMCRGGGVRLGGFSISAVRASGTELVSELFPGCSAPEQYSTTSPHGTWTDVYGLSAVLYICVTGQCPPEALIRSAARELPPPRERNETVPPRVSLAILQGLSLRPEDRIRTLSDLTGRIAGPFQSGGDSPTIAIPAARPPASRPAPQEKAPAGETRPASRPGARPAARSAPQETPPKKSKVVQGTSDRRLLINSMLITLPILLLILIFTFWYLFGGKGGGGESEESSHFSGTSYAHSSEPSSQSSSQPASSRPAVSSAPESSEESREESSEESSEPQEKMVSLVGQRYEDAAANADYRALFTLAEPQYIYSESDPAGVIVWQSIAAGGALEPGTEVQVKVSKGSQYVQIPGYEKQTEAEYTRLLEELGIRYTVVYQKDSIYPGGYVTGLDHMEGSKYDLEKAIVVQVYVSSRED